MTPDDGLALQYNSPALNAGDPMANPSLFPGGPDHPLDLAGLPRFDNRIDMGAYEYKDVCIDINRVVYVDSAAVTGTNDGTSWDNAFTDLQDALRRAWECPDKVDTILVAVGTYFPTTSMDRTLSFDIPSGVVILGGFSPLNGITTPGQRDWRIYETVLSGNIGMVDNSDNSYHVVTTLHVDSTTIVDGFTISDGNADGSGPYGSGGGWYNDGSGIGNHSNPTIRNCKFYFNRADLGGAMLNFGEMGGNSSPTLLDCEFIENGAVISGGAIANRATNGYSSPELINYVFVHNNTGVNSGAILNYGAEGTSSPIMTICLFQGS